MFSVNFSSYPRIFNNKQQNHDELGSYIKAIIEEKLTLLPCNKVDIFILKNPYHHHNAGRVNERFVIYCNATSDDVERCPVSFNNNIVLFGKEIPTTELLKPSGKGLIFYSSEGHPVAEFFEDKWEMNILFDIFANNDLYTNIIYIFDKILDLFCENFLNKLAKESSWIYTSNKEKLSNVFTTQLHNQITENLRRDRRDIENLRANIYDLKFQIKQRFDMLAIKIKSVEAGDIYYDECLKNLISDLNIIAEHEKVIDIIIDNEYVIIKTIPLKIYADDGNTYQIGNFDIKINIYSSVINFTSNKGYRGFWTDHDPHPHINGRDGYGCLGNIDATVAELCSQFQLYPLFLILIDYLETVNTKDAAGKYVINFPLIDGDKVIENDNPRSNFDEPEDNEDESDDSVECDYCGEYFANYHGSTVYESLRRDYDDGIYAHNDLFVCPRCLDEHFSYCDEVDEYISNDFDMEGFFNV